MTKTPHASPAVATFVLAAALLGAAGLVGTHAIVTEGAAAA